MCLNLNHCFPECSLVKSVFELKSGYQYHFPRLMSLVLELQTERTCTLLNAVRVYSHWIRAPPNLTRDSPLSNTQSPVQTGTKARDLSKDKKKPIELA